MNESNGSTREFHALIARIVEDEYRTGPLPRSGFDRATSDRALLFTMLRCPDSISLRVKPKDRRR